MTTVTHERWRQVRSVVAAVRSWAADRPDLDAVLVVGSYAYGRPTQESDVDLVIAVLDRAPLLVDDSWIRHLLGDRAEVVREQDWGPLRERRYRTADGLEVELGLVTPAWLEVPVDPGTANVLRDGCLVVTDPSGTARRALESLDLPVECWPAG